MSQTEHRPAHPHVDNQETLPAAPLQPSWYRRRGVALTGVALISLLVGVGIGGSDTDVTTTPEYKALAADLNAAKAATSKADDEAATLNDQLADAKDEVAAVAGDLPEREQTLKDGQAKLKQDQQKLDDRADALAAAEADVAAREKAVGTVEQTIARNTISGEGMYAVGKDIQAGTYKTNGKRGCYYAVLNSTDTFDIANNNNVDGPAFVTVAPGQYLELSGCADWVRQTS